MNNSDLYCVSATSFCRTMNEWGVHWQALTAICAVIVGAVGLYKIYHEIGRLVDQRKKDIDDNRTSAKLKRTEFFLSQHRRLFDNTELYSILCLIDDDSSLLADEYLMPDKKRKFLTFLEEIALLVKSEQIEKNVAYYMFGYYAICTLNGKNFASGIDTSQKYWGLLYEFTKNSKTYFEQYPNGPPPDMTL